MFPTVKNEISTKCIVLCTSKAVTSYSKIRSIHLNKTVILIAIVLRLTLVALLLPSLTATLREEEHCQLLLLPNLQLFSLVRFFIDLDTQI